MSHWRYSGLNFFPETAIAADTTKQNYAIYPRSTYVDIEEECEVCGRPFIFFAQEQKHWFEELGFWIDAHCTRCVECRKKDQEIRLMQKRYQVLVETENRAVPESRELKKIAMELYQLGYLRDEKKLNIDIRS
ncbi:zinc-ribbon domain-containing protein [Shewanella sp.]|uniref:zinc-ribbon domain-containing protein n=1 Tax=Shewanella sp. TaxID=50422 RepID=UPI001EC0E964|nr:zinc-ribbon domain-containing protein [Shewanella sp.]NRB25515.1 zinc-ribbon domain-containing protein [Shewanella sp.]